MKNLCGLEQKSEFNWGPKHIFVGIQYWTNLEDQRQFDFSAEVSKQLGWLQEEVPMTPKALQGYDALAVITKALVEKRFTSSGSSHWWADLGPIHGIKGQLSMYDKVTFTAPADLLQIDRTGKFRFSLPSQNCPI